VHITVQRLSGWSGNVPQATHCFQSAWNALLGHGRIHELHTLPKLELFYSHKTLIRTGRRRESL